MTCLLIKNGRVIDPGRHIDETLDLAIDSGLISALAKPGELGSEAGRVIDAAGLWVLPGLIDMHVHLREPGHEYKETVASGTRAAAAGGLTQILAMPNTEPALDNASAIASLLATAKNQGVVKVWAAGAMTLSRQGELMTEYEDLRQAGAVAVTDDGSWLKNPKVLRRVLDYAAVTGLLPLSHAEDHELSCGGIINEGPTAARLGLAGIPAQAEINAVTRDINMVELTGRPLHFCHISTAGALEAIGRAKARGLPVSCETAPHYLFLTDQDVGDYDPNAKMNPPLRSKADRAVLRQALAEGLIDVVATDHAPHSVLEKEVEFRDAAFGIIGLESSLPLMLRLVREKLISAARLVELMSLNPARLLKIPGGTLEPGGPAHLTLVDPNLSFTLRPEDSFSLSRNSPFWGWDFTGRAVMTIVDGRMAFELEK